MATHSRIQYIEDLGEWSWGLLQWKPYKFNISILKKLTSHPVTGHFVGCFTTSVSSWSALHHSFLLLTYLLLFYFPEQFSSFCPYLKKLLKIHHPFPCKLIKILRRTKHLAHHKCHPSLGTFVLAHGIYCLHSKWKVQRGFSWVLS